MGLLMCGLLAHHSRRLPGARRERPPRRPRAGARLPRAARVLRRAGSRRCSPAHAAALRRAPRPQRQQRRLRRGARLGRHRLWRHVPHRDGQQPRRRTRVRRCPPARSRSPQSPAAVARRSRSPQSPATVARRCPPAVRRNRPPQSPAAVARRRPPRRNRLPQSPAALRAMPCHATACRSLHTMSRCVRSMRLTSPLVLAGWQVRLLRRLRPSRRHLDDGQRLHVAAEALAGQQP